MVLGASGREVVVLRIPPERMRREHRTLTGGGFEVCYLIRAGGAARQTHGLGCVVATRNSCE
jgi:hypothetical protein